MLPPSVVVIRGPSLITLAHLCKIVKWNMVEAAKKLRPQAEFFPVAYLKTSLLYFAIASLVAS